MTSLTPTLAASPATPRPVLDALLTAAVADPGTHRRTLVGLAGNPALTAAQLDQLAGSSRADIRCALLANPATTAEQARTWLAGWTRPAPQPLVWRAAIRHVPDPDGTLAQAALARHQARWLLAEILDSDTTSEAARTDAAKALARAGDKLHGTERDRVLTLVRRNAALVGPLLYASSDETLSKTLRSLARHHTAGVAPTGTKRLPVPQLAAWMARAETEADVLAALEGDTRAGAWRAAAHALRPGWDTLADAVLADARSRLGAPGEFARTNALALLASAVASPRVRSAAAHLVATDPQQTRALSDLARAVPTAGDRNDLALVVRSPSVVRWLATTCPDLTGAAVSALAAAMAAAPEIPGPLVIYGPHAIGAVLARPDLDPDTRAALVRSVDRWDRQLAEAVLELPWHKPDALSRACTDRNLSEADCRALLWHHVGARRATDPGTGLGPLGTLPAALLRQATASAPVLIGHVGALAAAVVHDAGATTSDDLARVLLVVDALLEHGFPGTLAELAATAGGAAS